MLNSVRTRVSLRYSLLFGLLALFIGVGVYAYLKRDAYIRLDENTKTLLGVIKLAAKHEIEEHGGKQSGEEALREVMRTLYQTSFPQEQVAVWDGSRLVAFKPNLGRKQNDLRQVRFRGEQGAFNSGDLRVAVSSVYVPQAATSYRVFVSTWRGDTLNDLAALSYGLEMLIPLSFLLAAGSGYLLARRTLAPLSEIAEAMDGLTSKNLDERIAIKSSHDEIGRLAARFNQLLGRLQRAFQQQRRFMADASHELRTPIAAALTAAQVTLRDPNRKAEHYREALQIVEEQMLRLRRIVEDMFLLARADTDSLRLREEEFYLDELVGEACRAMRVLAERAGITLTLVKPMPEVRMFGDSGLLQQAIIILLDNACKYNRSGGFVRVSLEANEESCVLRVADTGPGIPESAWPQLFDRFFRVDASRARRGEKGFDQGSGAGLGLAIARWIAEQHKGSLTLESSTEKGSVFSLQVGIPASAEAHRDASLAAT